MECPICYTTPSKNTYMTCKQCCKQICCDCFYLLTKLECPLCKQAYHKTAERPEEKRPEVTPPEERPEETEDMKEERRFVLEEMRRWVHTHANSLPVNMDEITSLRRRLEAVTPPLDQLRMLDQLRNDFPSDRQRNVVTIQQELARRQRQFQTDAIHRYHNRNPYRPF
jgi:hypothetical protein